MLSVFLDAPDLARCTSLRRVICSGEALPYELQQRCFAQLPAGLHNLYGPTEAAVDVTAWACQREQALGPVPIGKPVANTQIHLVDQQMQPVPVWVPGELLIGGVQVARGYLDRPGLTAERFIPDPFAETAGARLYHTGDLAYRLPDSSIVFVGRIDDQVKLRGFRIELGEIEVALRQHPAVRECAVVMREAASPGSGSADQRLVAYVVAQEPRTTNQEAAEEEPGSQRTALGSQELRTFLAELLPEYMIPTVFVMLDALPLTATGKLNRRALPEAGAPAEHPALLAQDEVFVAPRSALEHVLAGIWSGVLDVSPIGVHDNFFALGGHSLHAARVILRVRQVFKIELAVHHLVSAPSVGQLAQLMAERHDRPGQLEKTAQILQRLEQMQDEDVAELLRRKRNGGGEA